MRHPVSILLVPAIALGMLAGLSCSGNDGRGRAPARMWTEAQAESITTIRGMRVHVRRCRGLGRERRSGRETVYGRFSCLAGARAAHEPVDTVAVTYVLQPLGPYRGRSSKYTLSDVHFDALQVP